jgi:hypothetical protein
MPCGLCDTTSIDRGKEEDLAKKVLVSSGIDVNAVAGWLGSHGGEDSPADISRGMVAAEVSSIRLLKLFERENLKSSWFMSGRSIESFPEQMKAAAAAGREIGLRGGSGENFIAMMSEQAEAVLDRSIELDMQLSGQRPTGSVAPWWEFSPCRMSY